MSEYHKINSLYKRNKITNHLIPGDWSIPEFEYLADVEGVLNRTNNFDFFEDASMI